MQIPVHAVATTVLVAATPLPALVGFTIIHFHNMKFEGGRQSKMAWIKQLKHKTEKKGGDSQIHTPLILGEWVFLVKRLYCKIQY